MIQPSISASKESERVTALQEKGLGVTTFRKVEIDYSDGTPFYKGWIQIFGEDDGRNGPTIFPENYANHQLEPEEVFRKEKYWETPVLSNGNTELREATASDLDQIVDLRFQNYFDGGHERISADQGLMHKMDDEHLSVVFTSAGEVYGYIYFDLRQNAHLGEAYIDSWFCAPGLRRLGMGTALLQAGMEMAKKRGFARVSSLIIGDEQHCEYNARILDRLGFQVDYCVENVPGILNARMVKSLS